MGWDFSPCWIVLRPLRLRGPKCTVYSMRSGVLVVMMPLHSPPVAGQPIISSCNAATPVGPEGDADFPGAGVEVNLLNQQPQDARPLDGVEHLPDRIEQFPARRGSPAG